MSHAATSSIPSMLLHGRRLPLSPTQVRLLAALLAQPGRLVEEGALPRRGPALARQISRLRSVVAPHGLVIYRVPQRGFVLLTHAQEQLP